MAQKKQEVKTPKVQTATKPPTAAEKPSAPQADGASLAGPQMAEAVNSQPQMLRRMPGAQQQAMMMQMGQMVGNQQAQRLVASANQSSSSPEVQRAPKKSSEEVVMDRVRQYDAYIKEASEKYGISMDRIRAIIATESAGKPEASSGAAFGLMQITKGTWQGTQKNHPELKDYDFTEANWKDPRINIMMGTAVFKSKMKAVGIESSDAGSAELAVIAYNAGEGTVKAAITNARNAGSKNPTAECLQPEYLKPAIKKTGIYSYYLTGKGKQNNPYANGTKPYDEAAAIEAAVDLKYKEVSRYPGTVQKYLAIQQSDASTSASAGAPTTETQAPKQNSNEPKAQVYKVQPGEGLQAIADKLGVTVAALKEANQGKLKQWKTKTGVIEGFNAGEIIQVPASSSRTESQVKTQEEVPAKDNGGGEKAGFNIWDMIKQGANMVKTGIEKVGDFAKSIWQGLFGGGGEKKATSGGASDQTAAPEKPAVEEQGSWSLTAKEQKELAALMAQQRLTSEQIARAREIIAKVSDPKVKGDFYQALQSKVVYANQRDNATVVNGENQGDVMCNLTSLAMALQYLGIPNPYPDMQFEDALEKIRQDKKLPARTTADGWGGVAKEVGATYKMITGGGGQANNKKWYQDNVLSELRGGAAIMLSIQGHIVRMQDVTDAGLVIDDPYGKVDLKTRQEKGFKGGWKEYNKRPGGGGPKENAGEDNVWPWDHVEKYPMRWIAAIKKA
ncbi:MAG: transglycosylase SLT domain-containing protein [Anaerolineae bacterium]|nr:transglycosylase SLT domain-containing protein [Anaerolineae bacterium]